MEDLVGFLIVGAVLVVVIALIVIYIIIPLLTVIAVIGLVYGGYFAIANYASAFDKVIIQGNRP